jgi:glycosyltransferase involved in cell wall biosynthesis
LEDLLGSQRLNGEWPRVTIVTPSYNQAAFLEDTIRSVLDQAYPNLEYLVIDGGSNDGSVEIIRRHEKAIDYWESVPDRGQCHAINKGWQRSTGEILAYLNSDDLYTPGAILQSVRYLQAHQHEGLVYASAHTIDEHGKRLGTLRAPAFDLRRFVERDFIPQPTVFFRRDVFRSVGLLDETLHYWLDYEYWLRATGVTTFGRLESVTALMRLHPESKTVSQVQDYQHEFMRIFDPLLQAHPEFRRDRAPIRRLYFHGLVYAAGISSRVDESVRRRAIDGLREADPPPSTKEITALVAINDAARDKPGDPSLAGVPDGLTIDACGIVPSLLEGGVVSLRGSEQILRRLKYYAELRRARRQREFGLLPLLPILMKVLTHDAGILVMPSWWSEILRSWPLGQAAIDRYRVAREVTHSVCARLLRFRPPTRSRGT